MSNLVANARAISLSGSLPLHGRNGLDSVGVRPQYKRPATEGEEQRPQKDPKDKT
jgi:hypothetical protein